MKYAGVVVLYNPQKADLLNIDTYIENLDVLYIVDNSTVKHAYAIDLEKKDRCEYIFNGQNLGIATALNIGAKKAIDAGYKWILTLDQDTCLNKEVFLAVNEYIEKNDCSKIGIICPWHNTKLLDARPKEIVDHPLDVMTSGNFVNLDVYIKIGGYKEWLFIDGVDIEYCLNLKKNGYVISRINNIEVVHDLGDIKIKKILWRKFICTNHNYLRNYYMQRNYRYIRDMYMDIAPEFCKTLVKIKQITFKILVFENDKYRKIRNIYRGIKDYKKGIKGVYRFKN